MKDEKLYTQFGSIRSGFLATSISKFFTLGGSLAETGWGIFVRFNSKNQKLINLSKTGSFVEIFQREPTKIINLVKKVVKNRRFLVIFSTKTRYCSLDSLDKAQKWGSKWNIIVTCYKFRFWKFLFCLGGEILGSEVGICSEIEISTYLTKADFWVPNGQISLIIV